MLDTSQRETPASWDRRKIKFHLSGFFGGGTPSKDNLEYWTDGTVPWVTPKDMKRRKIDTAEDLITVDAVKNSATNMVPPSSVLMVVRSGILKHSLPVALNTAPVALNQDMKAFRFRRSLLPEFFAYWIEGQQKQKLLEWCQIGATVDNIDVDAMLNGQIVVPDLATQRQIADFLDRETARIDLLIEKKQRLVALLGERKTIELEKLLFDSGFHNRKLRREARVISKGTTPSTIGAEMVDDGVRFLKAENVTWNGVNTSPENFVSEETHRALKRSSLQPGDVLVVIAGATTGKTAVMPAELAPANTNQAVSFVRLRELRYAEIACAAIGCPRIQRDILLTSVQSAQPNLSMEDLGNLMLPFPDEAEISAVLEQVTSINSRSARLIAATEISIDRLKEYRSALITAAVTGQIDVTTYAKSGTPDRRLDVLQEEMNA